MNALNSGRFNVMVFEGGSRSSKTYSLIQFFIIYAINNWQRSNRVVIARKKGTWLASTVWTDFKNILLELGLFNCCRINNTIKTIQLYTTTFEFVGLDDVQRLHGLTTDIFWINEAMEALKDALVLLFLITIHRQRNIGFMTMYVHVMIVTLTIRLCWIIRLSRRI